MLKEGSLVLGSSLFSKAGRPSLGARSGGRGNLCRRESGCGRGAGQTWPSGGGGSRGGASCSDAQETRKEKKAVKGFRAGRPTTCHLACELF